MRQHADRVKWNGRSRQTVATRLQEAIHATGGGHDDTAALPTRRARTALMWTHLRRWWGRAGTSRWRGGRRRSETPHALLASELLCELINAPSWSHLVGLHPPAHRTRSAIAHSCCTCGAFIYCGIMRGQMLRGQETQPAPFNFCSQPPVGEDNLWLEMARLSQNQFMVLGGGRPGGGLDGVCPCAEDCGTRPDEACAALDRCGSQVVQRRL